MCREVKNLWQLAAATSLRRCQVECFPKSGDLYKTDLERWQRPFPSKHKRCLEETAKAAESHFFTACWGELGAAGGFLPELEATPDAHQRPVVNLNALHGFTKLLPKHVGRLKKKSL